MVSLIFSLSQHISPNLTENYMTSILLLGEPLYNPKSLETSVQNIFRLKRKHVYNSAAKTAFVTFWIRQCFHTEPQSNFQPHIQKCCLSVLCNLANFFDLYKIECFPLLEKGIVRVIMQTDIV